MCKIIIRILAFVSNESTDFGLSIDYRNIGIQAVCQDKTIYSKPCMYCQIYPEVNESDEKMSEDLSQNDGSSDEEDSEHDLIFQYFEILFAPSTSEGTILSIFL